MLGSEYLGLLRQELPKVLGVRELLCLLGQPLLAQVPPTQVASNPTHSADSLFLVPMGTGCPKELLFKFIDLGKKKTKMIYSMYSFISPDRPNCNRGTLEWLQPTELHGQHCPKRLAPCILHPFFALAPLGSVEAGVLESVNLCYYENVKTWPGGQRTLRHPGGVGCGGFEGLSRDRQWSDHWSLTPSSFCLLFLHSLKWVQGTPLGLMGSLAPPAAHCSSSIWGLCRVSAILCHAGECPR